MDILSVIREMLVYCPDMEGIILELADGDPAAALASLMDQFYEDRIRISDDLLQHLRSLSVGDYYLEESYLDLAELQKELAADAA
ncbi:MAG: hypothetical protein E7Z96_02630 [Actinomycetaceae bacterium]|jgi:hypothetical protein|nr:hypothetical protein [Actinomycetaceae bacterium]